MRSSKSIKQDRILQRGFKMLQNYFDVGKLMRSVNLSQLMMAAILTKEQRLLLMFQRRQVVEDLSGSDDNSEQDMAKEFHGQITSKKPFDRIFALGKIAQVLKSYEDVELNQMDKKLIKGFYSNKLNVHGYL